MGTRVTLILVNKVERECNMREKIIKFMNGRNGIDDLAKFENMLVIIPILLMVLIRNTLLSRVLWIVVVLILCHFYFRVLSKNIPKRFDENQKFLVWKFNFGVKYDKKKERVRQMHTYKFFRCPSCKQEVRVPKGHGKICVTCPKCRREFIKHS